MRALTFSRGIWTEARWLRFVIAFAACSIVLAWCRDVAADPASEQKAPGAYTHDGFFMRFASGFGVYDEFARSETAERYGGRVNVRARGFAVAAEFSMGGTPYPGLVVGGGLYEVGVVTSSVTTNRDDDPDIEVADDLEIESRDLTIIGVFADRYFVPTVGLHVQAALGIAQQIGVSVDALEGKEIYDPLGPGIVLGIGYEMWLTEQWSLGVLARVGASLLFGEDRTGVQWVHYIASWPSFLMTVTYH